MKTFQKLLFIINPISGGWSKTAFIDSLEAYSKKYNFLYEIYLTTGNKDKQTLQQIISLNPPEILVAVGGDGTLILAAGLILHTNIKLGIIPFGSANGMAAELNIPTNKEEAFRVLFHGKNIKIDVIKIDNKYNCVHIGDIGFNAKMVKAFEKEKKRGRLSYARQFLREFKFSQTVKFKIVSENGSYESSAHMIAFANARKYGTKAVINPIGKLDDGYFELCIIKRISFKVFLLILLATITGSLYKSKFVKIIRCKKAKIVLKKSKKMTLQADGEILGERNKIQLELKPVCLNIMVPERGERSSLSTLVSNVTTKL
ncbi:diacylglycerol/lipid kinase family protein [Flexithrix dorotheae]|uniref:diacylglycerol/lipid kinase family protein n=1 Tax=Flexithrix dorotheae TaxID=70993 RepID=UPI00036D364B|nr:diacylglycerol kinase family protein [Flexithrix dorotheae]